MSEIGVLDKSYHIGRKSKKALIYRLNRRTSEVIRVIEKYYHGNPDSIIDLGTADGLMLSKIKDSYPLTNCIGIEYSIELIETNNDSRITILQGDVTAVDMPDNSFDIAVATAIIEHLADPKKFLKESMRLLKKDGLLILTSPDPFWEWIATFLGHLPHEIHNKVMKLKELSLLFKEIGFEIVEQKKFMLSPIGMPIEMPIENIIRKTGLNFLFANQLIVGRKASIE